jgi:cardiolipin synthase
MAFSSRWTSAFAVLGATVAMGCGAHGAAQAAPAAPAAQAAQAAGGGLRVLAEPQAGVAPFLSLIAGARSSIELTMYELFDHRVEQALVDAAHRGVNVRVLLNGGYYSEHEATNAAAYRYQKTLTVDGRESAIMTLNFDGLYPSTRDYAVLDTQPADVGAIVAAFNADYAGRRLTASAGTGDLVWSPHAVATVLGLMNRAKRSIDLENEEMAYTPAIDALCSAAHRGVRVRVVMTYASDWRNAFDRLEACGVSIHLYHGQRYYIHAKLLITDGTRALVSSQNLSTGSLQYNRELGIMLTGAGALRPLETDFGADYSGAA